MSPRTGRPTLDPKNKTVKFRLSDNNIKMLEYSSEKLGISKSDVIRLGIKKVYEEVNK